MNYSKGFRSRFLFCVALMSLTSGVSAQFSHRDTTLANNNTIHMKVNEKNGVPHRIIGLNVDFKRYGTISMNSISSMSTAFLTEYAELFRLETESLVLERSENRKGRWHINFTQEYEGIPVYYSSIGFTVFENGRIPLVGIDYYPDINVEPTPRISAEEALRIAQEDFTLLSQSDSISISQLPTLWIFPVENDDSYTHYLVYRLELKYRGFQSMFDESYFVDAHSGEILLRYSNILDGSISGYISYRYWPQRYDDSQITVAYANSKVELINLLGQATTQNTQSNGRYYFGNLAIQPFFIYPRFRNSYVRVRNESPNTSPWLYPTTTYSWTVGATDGSNVYWHANRIHNFFKGAPFYYNGMDYRMDAFVNEGSGYNGWADREDIGFGSETGRYWARSSDVVYHEYTHNTIAHLYAVGGDPSFICDGLSGNPYIEARAMDEGLSDYFACTVNNDSAFAASVLYYPYDPRILENDWQRYIPNGAYWNAQVIGGACWDLRQDVGVSLTNELVFDALYMSSHAYDFEDFAYNVLVADDNDGNLYNGTPHYDEIEEAFEINHGIPVYDPPLYVYITGPGEVYVGQNYTWTAHALNGTGSYSYQWYYRSYDTGYQWYIQGNDSTLSFSPYREDVDLMFKVEVDDGSTQASDFYPVDCLDCSHGGGDDKRIADWQEPLPESYALTQNHPNPFNPATTIRYDLPEASNVSLVIYDMLGREVRSWELQEGPGYRQVVWDGKYQNGQLAPTGLYIYRLVASSTESEERFMASRKMVLMK